MSGFGQRFSRFCFMLVMSVVVGFLSTSSAKAALLGLTTSTPDIASFAIDIQYEFIDATHGKLTAKGYATDLLPPDPPEWVDGTFDLFVDFNPSSRIAYGGELSIVGGIDYLGISAGTVLLKGSLDAFGFPESSPFQEFQFIFNVTQVAPELTSYGFGSLGSSVGVRLFTGNDTGFRGSFLTGFRNSGSGMADAFPNVPEPTSAVFWALSSVGAAIGSWRRRRLSA